MEIEASILISGVFIMGVCIGAFIQRDIMRQQFKPDVQRRNEEALAEMMRFQGPQPHLTEQDLMRGDLMRGAIPLHRLPPNHLLE